MTDKIALIKDLEQMCIDYKAELTVVYGLNVGLEARNEMLAKELALSKHQHNNALIELNKRVR